MKPTWWAIRDVNNGRMFWDDKVGWVDLPAAQVFPAMEKRRRRGLPNNGEWVALP